MPNFKESEPEPKQHGTNNCNLIIFIWMSNTRPLIECDHCLSSFTFAIFLILPAATTYQVITAHLTLSHNKTRKFYYIKTLNI